MASARRMKLSLIASRSFSWGNPASAAVSACAMAGILYKLMPRYRSIACDMPAARSKRRMASQRGLTLWPTYGTSSGSSLAIAASMASGYACFCGRQQVMWRCLTVAIKSSRPVLERAAVPMTGTPRRLASCAKSTEISFFAASSSKFTQTTTCGVVSIICNTRFKLRSNAVASHTAITQAGCSKQM